MINLVLDTNIILRVPKILGIDSPGIRLYVTIDVIEEINKRATLRGKSFDTRANLIEEASQNGIVTIVNTTLPLYRQYLSEINTSKLSGADVSIILAALALNNSNHEKVQIATTDKEIQEVAESHEISCLALLDVKNLVSISSKENPLQKKIF